MAFFLMRTVLLTAFFLLAIVNLHAQKEWIALKPANEKSENARKGSAQTIKIPPLQPVKTLVENAKTLGRLLDKSAAKAQPEAEGGKKWFVIKEVQND